MYEVEWTVKCIKKGFFLGGCAVSIGKQKERIVDTVLNMVDRENQSYKRGRYVFQSEK
jgi:hypothetical protein